MLLGDVLVYELRIPPFNLLISLEKKFFFAFLVKWPRKCCIYWGVMGRTLVREERTSQQRHQNSASSTLYWTSHYELLPLWWENIEWNTEMLREWNSPGSYAVITFFFLNSLCHITFKMKLLTFLLVHGKRECSFHLFCSVCLQLHSENITYSFLGIYSFVALGTIRLFR